MSNIKVEKLYKDHPKAMKSLEDFVYPLLLKDFEAGEIPEEQQEFKRAYADMVVSHTPRTLYDFFDKQELYISIDHDPEAKRWYWDISNKIEPITGNYAEPDKITITRVEAEKAAFVAAFKELEGKL